MNDFVKKNWKWIVGGFVVFVILFSFGGDISAVTGIER